MLVSHLNIIFFLCVTLFRQPNRRHPFAGLLLNRLLRLTRLDRALVVLLALKGNTPTWDTSRGFLLATQARYIHIVPQTIDHHPAGWSSV